MKIGNFSLDKKKTAIMGILNVTPDSFSDGNLFFDADSAVERAKEIAKEGADIIDIGAESSRPGSQAVSEEEELRRILPVVKSLVKELNISISIDTYKPKVADECLKLGAHMINDITGLTNSKMLKVISSHEVPAVIMHMQGTPKNMQKNPQYKNVVLDIKTFFKQRINQAKKYKINDLILDPGIGFGKTTEHNLQIIKHLKKFEDLNYPILIGTSRKSFIGNITGDAVNERLEGTIASITIAALNGADIVRVHDVKECRKALQVAD